MEPVNPAKRRAIDQTQLRLNPLARRLLIWQAIALVVSGSLYPLLGLSIDWRGAWPFVVADMVIFVIALELSGRPGNARERIVAETIFAFLLTLLLSQIIAPAQYAAAALNRPLIDPLLARVDAQLGIHVPSYADWVRTRPFMDTILTEAYDTLILQFALIVPILGLMLRDRLGLWEYVFHFHVCALVTVAALALFPAQCAYQYYGFESTIDQSRFIRHFNGLRDGSLTVIHMNDLEGLVSMPSFHVAGALMVTWAVRHRAVLLIPLGLINLILMAATFLSGVHYFVDLIVTVAMFALSVAAYRRWGLPLLDRRDSF